LLGHEVLGREFWISHHWLLHSSHRVLVRLNQCHRINNLRHKILRHEVVLVHRETLRLERKPHVLLI